jgi:hypothetical protein
MVDAANEGADKEDVSIIIDGTSFDVPKGKITFEGVVNLAFDNNPPSGPNVVITVTYSRGEGGHSGSLLPGSDVEVTAGMVFNVKATDKS